MVHLWSTHGGLMVCWTVGNTTNGDTAARLPGHWVGMINVWFTIVNQLAIPITPSPKTRGRFTISVLKLEIRIDYLDSKGDSMPWELRKRKDKLASAVYVHSILDAEIAAIETFVLNVPNQANLKVTTPFPLVRTNPDPVPEEASGTLKTGLSTTVNHWTLELKNSPSCNLSMLQPEHSRKLSTLSLWTNDKCNKDVVFRNTTTWMETMRTLCRSTKNCIWYTMEHIQQKRMTVELS